jgi:hypothetical protein
MVQGSLELLHDPVADKLLFLAVPVQLRRLRGAGHPESFELGSSPIIGISEPTSFLA